MALSGKRLVFINEYLKCWNATQAALKAGYSEKTAYSQGHRLLKDAEIQSAIEERIAETAMSANEVLIRLAEQARGAAEEFIEIKGGLPFLDWDNLKVSGKLRLIKKLKYDSNGRPEVEFYDAQAALVHLGRAHKLFTDRQEISGPDGAPLVLRWADPIIGDDDSDD